MPCVICGKGSGKDGGNEPVIELQQGPLCKEHFIRYFQRKVYKTIRRYGLFTKRDRLCVACSGGKDSLAVLYLVSKLARRQRQPIFALGIDEGVPGYRDRQLRDMQRFCEQNGIDYVLASFKDEYGHTIEELMQIAKKRKIDMSQCALCGILRRRLLNQYAKRLKATRIVVGHNLDDEAQTAMMNMFKGSIELAARMGPKTGAARHPGFVARVKPLYFCSELETGTYTRLLGMKVLYKKCPFRKLSYRAYVARRIEEIDREYKGTKTSIVQNLLQMLPALQKQCSKGKIPSCRHCGEPSKLGVCASCDMLRKLGIQ